MPAIPNPKTTIRFTYHPNTPNEVRDAHAAARAARPPYPNPRPVPPFPVANANSAGAPSLDRPAANSPYTPSMPYDEPASFPAYPSRIYRPKAGTDGTFSSDWEVRITSFELFVMLIAMLALLVILAWLAVLFLDWLLPRQQSRRRAVREVRKLSRALGSFSFKSVEEAGHRQSIPMHHHSRNGSERYSDMGGRGEEGRLQGIAHNLSLLGLGGRSRANSMRDAKDAHRESYASNGYMASAGSRRGSGGVLDIEKGQGGVEWVDETRNDGGRDGRVEGKVDVRRRSGAV